MHLDNVNKKEDAYNQIGHLPSRIIQANEVKNKATQEVTKSHI